MRTKLMPAPPPPPERQIIPVSLPTGNFQLQYKLGSVKNPPKDTLKPEQLPKFQPKLAMKLSISGNLGDAAAEAARAEAAAQRMTAQARAQTRVEETFVADIVLAESVSIVVPAPAPAAALTLEEQKKMAELAALPPEPPTPPEPVAAEKPRKPETRKAEPRKAPPVAAVANNRARAERPPEQLPTPEIAPPPKPVAEATKELPPLETWEPELPPPPPAAQIPPAREEQPLAALFIPGMEPAPDRGPGEFTEGAAVYFSKLTAHLFRANQEALANAVRVSGKITLDVRFYVDRSGRILGAQVVRSTGDTTLDQRAEQIILDASPVPRLAEDMPQRRLELSFPVDVYR